MSDERKRAEFLLRTQKYSSDADLVSPVVDAMLAFAAEVSAEKDAEIARLREDASRYRWLKENIKTKRWQRTHDIFSSFETLDTAIDAARRKTNETNDRRRILGVHGDQR